MGAGLTYGLIEAAFGLLLVLAAISRGHIPSAWIDIVTAVAHRDVGAFAARGLLATTRGLQRSAKFLLGIGLVVDGTVRSGLCVGALRRSRTATMLAAVSFAAIAAGGLVVAGANPPLPQFATALANSAIAIVVAVDAYRLRSGRVPV